MKSFQKVLMVKLGLLILSSNASAGFISNYSVKGNLNRSITHLLPDSVECTNQVMKSAEFSIRLHKTYGKFSQTLMNKMKNAQLDLRFWPSYPLSYSTIASTNMEGDVFLNNRKNRKTLSSLAATISHEGIHNLGFKHSDDVYPDVAYTVGNIVEQLVDEGRCELDKSATDLKPMDHTGRRESALKRMKNKVINLLKRSHK